MTQSEGERLLVLLRGINVGGHHLVPMTGLRALFADLGCVTIATYIQSGNLVCTAPLTLTSDRIAAELAACFGFPIPVTLRTRQQLETAIAANPFATAASTSSADNNALHVVFLDAPLTSAGLQKLEAARTGEERLHVHNVVPGSVHAAVPDALRVAPPDATTDLIPEAITDASGREIFLHLPYGTGRSKLAAACTASAIPGNPTIRNWRTVLELQKMLQAT